MSPGYRLSEESVRFYSAEILLALFHIHRMGLIYRDLKPSNVIVTSDGHVQLVDLGGKPCQDACDVNMHLCAFNYIITTQRWRL